MSEGTKFVTDVMAALRAPDDGVMPALRDRCSTVVFREVAQCSEADEPAHFFAAYLASAVDEMASLLDDADRDMAGSLIGGWVSERISKKVSR